MISRRIIAAFALLWAAPCLAQTGSIKTQAQLNTEINSSFTDNGVGAITPSILRQVTLDQVASVPFLNSANTFSAFNVFSVAPAFSSLTGYIKANGASAATAAATVPVGDMSTVAAATFLGNPTNATATPQAFTIQGLTGRGTPDPANDKIPVYDNAAGSIKYITPLNLAASTPATFQAPGFISGLQPLKLSGAVIAVNPGSWSNNVGTLTFSTTSVLTADLQSATPNFASNPATGAQVSGALTAVANSTDNTEVFLYLIHRNSDNKVALVGSSSDVQGPVALTFTATAATPGVLTTSAQHGMRRRMTLRVSNSGGALPSPLAANTDYFVCTTPGLSTLTLATSIANVNSGSCLTLTTTGTGTNTLTFGVQAEIDSRLGAGVATFDRRFPFFAFVWSFTNYGPSAGIPDFTVPQGGSRTVLTSFTVTGTTYCVTPSAAGSYTALSLATWLANLNRQVLLKVSCAGGGSGGACFVRPSGTAGNEPVVTAAAGQTQYGETELITDSVTSIDHSETGTAVGTYCVKGWTQMDPS